MSRVPVGAASGFAYLLKSLHSIHILILSPNSIQVWNVERVGTYTVLHRYQTYLAPIFKICYQVESPFSGRVRDNDWYHMTEHLLMAIDIERILLNAVPDLIQSFNVVDSFNSVLQAHSSPDDNNIALHAPKAVERLKKPAIQTWAPTRGRIFILKHMCLLTISAGTYMSTPHGKSPWNFCWKTLLMEFTVYGNNQLTNGFCA